MFAQRNASRRKDSNKGMKLSIRIQYSAWEKDTTGPREELRSRGGFGPAAKASAVMFIHCSNPRGQGSAVTPQATVLLFILISCQVSHAGNDRTSKIADAKQLCSLRFLCVCLGPVFRALCLAPMLVGSAALVTVPHMMQQLARDPLLEL